MVKVIAISKGYWGGMIREIGDRFAMPESEYKLTSWVRPDPDVAFGGKGDHDGDGFVGGSAPDTPRRRRRAKADETDQATSAEAQEAVGGIQPDWLPADN